MHTQLLGLLVNEDRGNCPRGVYRVEEAMWCEHAILSRGVSTLPLGQSATETHPHRGSFYMSWHHLRGLRIWDSSVLASLPKFWWLFLFLCFKLTNYLINLKVSPYQRHISE